MSVKRWSMALLCGALLAVPAAAQEDPAPKDEPEAATPVEKQPEEAAKKKTKGYEEPALHRWGGWTISLGAWQPTLIGGDEDVAVIFPDGKLPYPIRVGAADALRESWLVAYHLPKGVGSVVLKYDSMHYDDNVAKFTPGEFNFYELRAFPYLRGAFDDSLADGVRTHAVRKSRMTSLQFSRVAVDAKHARLTWGAGMQNIDSTRSLDIRYLAIVPNLPPVIPPIVPEAPDPSTYNPLPDLVDIRSDFSGNGPVGSLDVEFPFHSRVSIVSGLSIAILRGSLSTVYNSRNSYYFDARNPGTVLTKDELFTLLSTGSAQDVAAVAQDYVSFGLQTTNVSRTAQTYDLYVGLQANVWRGLKVFATYRNIYFADAAAYSLPRSDGTIETTTLASAYDGYMLGVSWRF